MGMSADYYRYDAELRTDSDADLIEIVFEHSRKDAFLVSLEHLPADTRRSLMEKDQELSEDDQIVVILQ